MDINAVILYGGGIAKWFSCQGIYIQEIQATVSFTMPIYGDQIIYVVSNSIFDGLFQIDISIRIVRLYSRYMSDAFVVNLSICMSIHVD